MIDRRSGGPCEPEQPTPAVCRATFLTGMAGEIQRVKLSLSSLIRVPIGIFVAIKSILKLP